MQIADQLGLVQRCPKAERPRPSALGVKEPGMVQQVWLHRLLRVLGPLWVYFESKRFVQVTGSEATTDQWFVSNRAAQSI